MAPLRHASGIWLGICALIATTACLRLQDPGRILCIDDSDCEEGSCVYSPYSSGTNAYGTSEYGTCVRKSKTVSTGGRASQAPSCVGDYDCNDNERCDYGTCVDVECDNNDAWACGFYSCSVAEGKCHRSCASDAQCRADKTCEDGQCVTPPSDQPLGTACTNDWQCASSVCCYRGLEGTCRAGCISDGLACSSDDECNSEHCCPERDRVDKICKPDDCVLGKLGEACVSDAYCESHFCDANGCALKAGSNGTSCSSDSECDSLACCPTGFSNTRVCKEEC